jgi:hypothetical protein
MRELLNGARLDPSKVLLIGPVHRPARIRVGEPPSWSVIARRVVGFVRR